MDYIHSKADSGSVRSRWWVVYPEPELTLSPEIRGRGKRGAERYNFRFREIERPFKFVGGFNLLFYLLFYTIICMENGGLILIIHLVCEFQA